MSPGVLNRPGDSRSAPGARCGLRPIAVSTGEGCGCAVVAGIAALAAGALPAAYAAQGTQGHRTGGGISQMLLISVDGLHQQDLVRYVRTHLGSVLASLTRSGLEYSHARTPFPSDSFPGMVGQVTGGDRALPEQAWCRLKARAELCTQMWWPAPPAAPGRPARSALPGRDRRSPRRADLLSPHVGDVDLAATGDDAEHAPCRFMADCLRQRRQVDAFGPAALIRQPAAVFLRHGVRAEAGRAHAGRDGLAQALQGPRLIADGRPAGQRRAPARSSCGEWA